MMIKKGGNWHRVEIWKHIAIGYKSGGFIFVNLESREEKYIPFYGFRDFIVQGDSLYVEDQEGCYYRINLRSIHRSVEMTRAESFPAPGEKIDFRGLLKDLLGEIRAYDYDNEIIAVAYGQKGIDFFSRNTYKKIRHFDFPGYHFIDDIKLHGNKLYVADVFGLRILDVLDSEYLSLDDSFVYKGWAKDVAVSGDYVYVADVLGIKIFDKKEDFRYVGKIESNKNRIAKVVLSGNYAFMSCEASGLKIADISDAKKPKFVSGLILPKGVWDCCIYGNKAYLAAYTEGLLKIDAGEIKKLELMGKYNGTKEIIGVCVNEKGVFAACSHSGLRLLDHNLAEIAAFVPEEEGRCWTTVADEHRLYVAWGQAGVFVFEITDMNKPVLIIRIKTQEARDLVVQGDTLYVADGPKGVLEYDISNITLPRLLRRIPSSAFTRGLMLDDKYIYKADGDGGLEIHGK